MIRLTPGEVWTIDLYYDLCFNFFGVRFYSLSFGSVKMLNVLNEIRVLWGLTLDNS